MIYKEVDYEGKKYLIGFVVDQDSIEIHIIKKFFGFKRSICRKLYLKGLYPNFKQMTLFFIEDYERELKQKEEILGFSL